MIATIATHSMLVISLLIIWLLSDANGLNENVRIIKYELCHHQKKYPLQIGVKFRTVKKEQYMDFNGTYEIPFVNNATISTHVALSLNGRNFVHMMSIYDDDYCRFQRRYMGEFYYRILEASGLKRTQCPVPKGTYIGHNIKVDYGNIPIDKLPNGVVRIRQIVTSTITKKTLNCMDLEIKNF